MTHNVVLLQFHFCISSNGGEFPAVIVVVGSFEPVGVVNANSSGWYEKYAGWTRYYLFYLIRSLSMIFLCHLDTFFEGSSKFYWLDIFLKYLLVGVYKILRSPWKLEGSWVWGWVPCGGKVSTSAL